MIISSPLVEDIMAEVVAAVSVRISRAQPKGLGMAVRFMHGPEEEIEANLIEIGKNQGFDNTLKKYPLIILFHDFTIRHDSDPVSSANPPRIIICTISDNKIKSETRKETSFKTVLYPIYEEFLLQLSLHKNTQVNYSHPSHSQIDRYYWGKKAAGTALNDFLDAIEIQNLEFGIFKNNCTNFLSNV